MFTTLINHLDWIVAVLLFGIGFTTLLLHGNLIKKIIVVSVSVTAVMRALTVRLYRRYHTLDIDRITLRMKGEDD